MGKRYDETLNSDGIDAEEYFICTKKLFNKKIKSGTVKCPIGCYELCGHEF